MNRLEQPRQTTWETAEGALPSPSRERLLKPYRVPRLKIYGRLAELTRFGGSVLIDSGGGLGRSP